MRVVPIIAAFLACEASLLAPASASVSTCSLHKGMTIYFLDYAENDYTLSHPLDVASGRVDIDEVKWHKKCSSLDDKIYVPFVAASGIEKGQWDTRYPSGIFLTRAAAEAAFRRLR